MSRIQVIGCPSLCFFPLFLRYFHFFFSISLLSSSYVSIGVLLITITLIHAHTHARTYSHPLILRPHHTIPSLLHFTPSYKGTYKWYVTLDNQESKRGHCMLGVATRSANLDCFLGQGPESWGLSTNKDLFACGKKIRSDYGHKLSRTGEN